MTDNSQQNKQNKPIYLKETSYPQCFKDIKFSSAVKYQQCLYRIPPRLHLTTGISLNNFQSLSTFSHGVPNNNSRGVALLISGQQCWTRRKNKITGVSFQNRECLQRTGLLRNRGWYLEERYINICLF